MCSSTAICWPWVPTRISTNAESTPRYDFWRATPSPEREFVRVDVERPSDVNALILSLRELVVADDEDVHAREDRGG
jgi:hypothetical protein